jgi:hypothetical protein
VSPQVKIHLLHHKAFLKMFNGLGQKDRDKSL